MSDPVSTEAQEKPYPTSEEIAELPDHVRSYIHDLEARCDPAGDLRRLDAEKQKRRELQHEVDRLRTALRTVAGKTEPSIHILHRDAIHLRKIALDALDDGGDENS